MRPCICEKCYVCWLWYHNTVWRVQHGGPSVPINPPESVLKHGPESIIRTPVVLPPIQAPVPRVHTSGVVVHHTSGFVVALPIARPNSCEFLRRRTEFRPGCGGWRCQHECKLGFKAVPGGLCQTCNDYVDSGEKFQ